LASQSDVTPFDQSELSEFQARSLELAFSAVGPSWEFACIKSKTKRLK